MNKPEFTKKEAIPSDFELIDTYRSQLEELEEINSPGIIAEKFERTYKPSELHIDSKDGVWVSLPWRKVAVHLLHKDDFRKVRLSRNQDLITETEQQKLLEKKIAIAGLNVGHPGAICLAQEGISERMRIADLDTLSLSNLNRFRAGICELGISKVDITARQIYEIDPYYELELFSDGISPDNTENFLNGIDLLIEEMDNMPLKLKIREAARSKKVPVLMVTGNDAGLIIDVERYDLDENLPLLNGNMPKETMDRIYKLKPGESRFSELIQLLQDFMQGEKNLHKSLLNSFKKVGTELAGIPQLSEASFIRGSMLCYFARMILIGKMPSGRYFFHPSTLLED